MPVPTFTGKELYTQETGRAYAFTGLGVDWAGEGYSLSLQITAPDGTVTYKTLLPVSGQPLQAQIGVGEIVYAMDGRHKFRLIAHTGNPENEADIRLKSNIYIRRVLS